MSKVHMLRVLVNDRLTAAVEDIFGVFERTIAEYEEEVCRSKEENRRQQKLLDSILQPEVHLNRTGQTSRLTVSLSGCERQNNECEGCRHEETQGEKDQEVEEVLDPQQLFVCKEEVPPEQQEWSPSLDQEEPEPLHIKEEQEELFIQRLEEAEVPTLILLPENSENNEEEQSSQLNPTQTDENREAEPPASTSIEQMKTDPDSDDCGVSELVGNLEPAGDLEPVSDDQFLSSDGCETETEDSDDDNWKETREPQSCLNTLKSKKTQRVEGQSLSVSNKFRRSMEASNELKPSNQIPSLVGCKLCEKTFPSNMSLKRHAIVHSEGCGLCGKHFDSTENLKLHFVVHNTCSICSKKCCSISKLERHMRVHTRQKPFSCSVCGKCFSRTDILKIHMRSHTGEKPFSCTFCEKGFSLKDGLNKHLRCHTGEKPFSCSLCGQRFSVKSCLQKHMIVHTGEKPFSCSVCGKRFGQKYYLKTHRRLHTGEKPYGCSVCGKSFRWLSDVKSHKCVSESTSRGR